MTDRDRLAAEPWYSDHPCPKCGKRIEMDYDCPGYPTKRADGTTGIMVCGARCGNAVYYACEDDDGCGWWWREPNRRGTVDYRGVEMGPKPDWMDDECRRLL